MAQYRIRERSKKDKRILVQLEVVVDVVIEVILEIVGSLVDRTLSEKNLKVKYLLRESAPASFSVQAIIGSRSKSFSRHPLK